MLRVPDSLRIGAVVVAVVVGGCRAGPTPPTPAVGSPSVASPAAAGPTPGTTRTDAHGVAQVWVPAGVFGMGTDGLDPSGILAPPDWARFELAAERPQHEVALSAGYWIDQTEVTNDAYQAFVDDAGYTTSRYWSDDGTAWLAAQDVVELPTSCGEAVAEHPRVCITWFEAEAYAA